MRRHSDGCSGVLLIASFLLVLFVLARPLGTGLARLINNVALPGTGSIEKGIWRVLGIDDREMNWRQYLMAILLLNIVGLVVLFAMLMLQGACRLIRSSCLACPASGAEHSSELCDQHELAILCR